MPMAATLAALDAAIRVLPRVDFSSASRDDVVAVLHRVSEIAGWIEATRGRAARRLTELAECNASVQPGRDLARTQRADRRDGERRVERAATLGAAPALDESLAKGLVSAGHVDALTRALSRLDAEKREQLLDEQQQLADLATRVPPRAFDQHLKRRVAELDAAEAGDRLLRQKRAWRFRSWTDRDTGMVHGHFELDPETGLRVLGTIDRLKDALFRGQRIEHCPDDGTQKQQFLAAVALVRLIDGTGAGRGGTPTTTGAERDTGRSTDIVIVVDEATMRAGLHASSRLEFGREVDLGIDTIRRLACSAGIIPVVLNGDGVALDVGRRQRLATAAQWAALRAMYRTCAIDGCAEPIAHCQPHHIEWWRPPFNGPTNLDNLVPVCPLHHRLVHEGGWKLQLDERRVLTATTPDGAILVSGPPGAQWVERPPPEPPE